MIWDEEEPLSYREQVERTIARAKLEQAVELPGEPITVRISRATELLGIGRSKLYELIGQREIDTIKVGSATLVIVASLKAFVQRKRDLVPTSPLHLSDLQKSRGPSSDLKDLIPGVE